MGVVSLALAKQHTDESNNLLSKQIEQNKQEANEQLQKLSSEKITYKDAC